MLCIKSTIYLTGQANNNDRNSKSQTKKQSLTRRKHLRCALNRFEFMICNLRPARSCLAMAGGFICNLVLGICDFRHKTPRQSHLSLTWLSEA